MSTNAAAPALSPLPAQLHRAIVEQAPDAIIFADREGTIQLWNRGAELVFGHAASEAVGRNLDLIVPERFRAAHNAGFQRSMETGVVRNEGRVLTTRSAHKDGSRLYVDLSFGLVKDDDGRVVGAFAIGRDCTARQLAQAERHTLPAAGSGSGAASSKP